MQSFIVLHRYRVHSTHPERVRELDGQDIIIKDGKHKWKSRSQKASMAFGG
ncbi:MAG: hypothetical protein GX260_03280 [Tissierellia bacterium]|jgi:hypothetical protein|nr:hypothetical protein [Tissierellia bacterium]